VDLRITTAQGGWPRPCAPGCRAAVGLPGHSLRVQEVNLLVALLVGNLQLCFLLHYRLLHSAQKVRDLEQHSEFTIFNSISSQSCLGRFRNRRGDLKEGRAIFADVSKITEFAHFTLS